MGLIKDKWGGVIELMNEAELIEMKALVVARLGEIAPLDTAVEEGKASKKKGRSRLGYWMTWVDALEPAESGKRGRYAVLGDWTTRKEIARAGSYGTKRLVLVGVKLPEQKYAVLRSGGAMSARVERSGEPLVFENAQLLFESDDWDEVREALVEFGVPVRDNA